jgi:isopentenyldiphosphate isomerase
MDKFRKHIKESFFNPVFHFLPLLIFLVVDDFFGITLAWEISFPFALVLLIYTYFAYNRIFTWHLIGTIIFVAASLIAAVETLLSYPFINHEIVYESVVLTFFTVFVIFRSLIQKIVQKLMSNLIPMTNNFEELYRAIWTLGLVLVFYVSGFLIIQAIGVQVHIYQQFLRSIFLGIMFFLVAYEILRVQLIRSKLIREEWLPIVNNQGKIIGSIQHNISLNDEKKYQHPVVRILFVDRGMILLNKKMDENAKSSDLWDSTISAHVVMEESIEQCVARTVKKKLDIDDFKYMFLSNYTVDYQTEIQYSFLFVSCLMSEFKLSERFVEQAKWWTQSQIEENLTSGIFTESFKIEYDLLKRSGLLETGKCECNCRLKQVIYNQSNSTKKE